MGTLQARRLELPDLLQQIFVIQDRTHICLCLLHWQMGSLPLSYLGSSALKISWQEETAFKKVMLLLIGFVLSMGRVEGAQELCYLGQKEVLQLLALMRQCDHPPISVHDPDLLNSNIQLQLNGPL